MIIVRQHQIPISLTLTVMILETHATMMMIMMVSRMLMMRSLLMQLRQLILMVTVLEIMLITMMMEMESPTHRMMRH